MENALVIPMNWVSISIVGLVFIGVLGFIIWFPRRVYKAAEMSYLIPKSVEHTVTLNLNVKLDPKDPWGRVLKEVMEDT